MDLQTAEKFSELVNQNHLALHNYARKLCKYSSDSADLLQETLFKAYKGFHTFTQGTSFKSWTFAIMRNTFITQVRKKQKKDVASLPIEDLIFACDQKSYHFNGGPRSLLRHKIEAHIANLSDKSRKPFELHIEGYRYREISEKLDIPIGTVKSRISFARGKLQKELTASGIAA